MMRQHPKNPPFAKNVKHIQELNGVDFRTALDSVQATYNNFKNRNQKLIERQNDQSNTGQIQLISHFALLATLSFTVVGFLMAQESQNLTFAHQILIVVIASLEIASLFFGAFDYIQTIKFHNRWAVIYQNIDKEVDEKISTGELQWTKEINEIEAKHLASPVRNTNPWTTYLMVGLCLAGLVMTLVLFGAYFFDVPFYIAPI